MTPTFVAKPAHEKHQSEVEPAEAAQLPEVVTATPRYLQDGFSTDAPADDAPPSPLLRSQIKVQTKLTINTPGDAYEQEADRVAQQVMRSSTPRYLHAANTDQIQRQTMEEEEEVEGQVQTKRIGNDHAPAEAPVTVSQTISRSGQPLDPNTRAFMEDRFGQDFSGVQVHTDSQAAQSAADIGAQAYTVGQHIAFGAGRYAPGTTPGDTLIAHELTHVVQQRGQSTPFATGGAVAVQQSTSDEFVQRLTVPDWVLDQLPAPVANFIREIEASGGIFEYIEGLMSGIVERVFGGLEQGANTVVELIEAFTTLYTTIPVISISIASGNRELFTSAVENLANALQTIVGTAWDALELVLGPVRDFLNGVVATLDQPIEQWIETIGGTIWTTIIDIGRDLWNWTADLREGFIGEEVWEWVRDFLDITGPDTYDGLVNWIEEQAATIWASIKDGLSGVITGIQDTATTIQDVISVENIKSLRETVDGWIITARDFILALNSDDGNGIASQQELLRTVLIPMLQSGAAALRELVIGAGNWVAGLIGTLAEKVTGFIATLAANSLIGAVIPELFTWVTDAIAQLANWAQNIVIGLFTSVGDTIDYLAAYIEPFLTTLINLLNATTDLVGSLPDLLTAAWEAIPAWIRDPIKAFILNEVLARIPIFGDLVTQPDVWARVQATAMQILQQIFVTGDLVGAAWTFFQALLELLNFPTDLVVQIVSKATAVFTQIFEDPVGFLLNLLKAVKQGFVQFFGNILNHLLQGVTDWLFGQAAEAGIQPPSDLSLGSILQFVLDILGLNMDMIWERLALKIGEERVEQIKTAINVLTGAWEWVSIAINEGPGALWEMIQSQISGLWTTIINAAMQWIMMKVIEKATLWLLSLLDPTGIMAVVNSLIAMYKAIESFIEYIRDMLEIINTVLDGIGAIAAGIIAGAANYLENALADSLPIAIGFLANQFGLGKLGEKLGEIIQTVREYVVRGVDWLIDRALSMAQGALNLGRQAVGAAVDWWRQEETFTDSEGERHRIYFTQSGDGYHLMIASNPRAARAFLEAVQIPDEMEQRRQAALVIANRLDQTEEASETVDDDLAALAEHVGALYASSQQDATNFGTQANPYRIKWHKVFSDGYPVIRLRPAPDQEPQPYRIDQRATIRLSERQEDSMYSRTDEQAAADVRTGLTRRQEQIAAVEPETTAALDAARNARTTATAAYRLAEGGYTLPGIGEFTLQSEDAFIRAVQAASNVGNDIANRSEEEICQYIVERGRTLRNLRGTAQTQINEQTGRLNNQGSTNETRTLAQTKIDVLNEIVGQVDSVIGPLDRLSRACTYLDSITGPREQIYLTSPNPHEQQLSDEARARRANTTASLSAAERDWQRPQSVEEDGVNYFEVTVGVMPQYMVRPGTVLGPKIEGARAPNSASQNRFKEYIFRAGHDMSAAGQDAEHVTDLAFSGIDAIANLWPLGSGNPVPNQVIYKEVGADWESMTAEEQQRVQRADGVDIGNREFLNQYFIVES